MVFSDQTFLFFFLPIALLAGVLTKATRLFSVAVFASSMVFFYWSSGIYTLILMFSIALNYVGGLVLHRHRNKLTLAFFVGVNFAVLVFFKYMPFLLANIGYLGSPSVEAFASGIVLPIGISFYTFQGVSYLIDVWRGDVAPERNFITFGAYKAFFPQLIAGPIVRYKDVHEDFHNPRASADMFAAGASRFLVGLGKKVIVADSVALVANAALALPPDQQTFATAWLGALAYTIQIYFDFSGYSDMAIGLALMFGIRFLENFNHPYAASTVTDFWRRWHISLSTWFRDYFYIPLGGNRHGSARTYFNLALVFLVTGFWHGAAWTFVLWGIWHGAFLIGERVLWGGRAAGMTSPYLRLFYLLPVVIFGWVLFAAPDIRHYLGLVRAMLSPLATDAFTISDSMVAALAPMTIVIFAVVLAGVLMQNQIPPVGVQLALEQRAPGYRLFRLGFVTVASLVSLAFVVPQGFSPFLYFRF